MEQANYDCKLSGKRGEKFPSEAHVLEDYGKGIFRGVSRAPTAHDVFPQDQINSRLKWRVFNKTKRALRNTQKVYK